MKNFFVKIIIIILLTYPLSYAQTMKIQREISDEESVPYTRQESNKQFNTRFQSKKIRYDKEEFSVTRPAAWIDCNNTLPWELQLFFLESLYVYNYQAYYPGAR